MEGGNERLEVGLALSGGGAHGFAHIGAIRALQSLAIPIGLVVGTSMGAIIGGAFASGIDLDKLERILANLDLHDLLDLPRNSFQERETVLGRFIAERFSPGGDWHSPSFPYQQRVRRLCEFFIFSQLTLIVVRELSRAKLELTQEQLGPGYLLVLQPPFEETGWFEFAKIAAIATIGEEEVR